MRRIIVAATLSLTILASCSPTTPAAADPTTTTQAPAATSDPCRPGDRPCWEAHIQRQRNERLWWAERRAQQVREQADRAWRANLERLAAHLRAQAAYPSGQCGGSLPPCWVMMRESRGDIHAQNPHSTASGKWQFLDSTWGRYRGYAKARYAPEWVQDERARALWAGGRGCSHWSACR